jgi:23S rRNA (adenine2503-C2)-methyltransferase
LFNLSQHCNINYYLFLKKMNYTKSESNTNNKQELQTKDDSPVFDLSKLNEILKDLPKFRSQQIYEGVFSKLYSTWEEMTFLPRDLRPKLAKEITLEYPSKLLSSLDGEAEKAVIFFNKNEAGVETVLMRHADKRNTVCISSQLGCAMACSFCLTGSQGLSRNLKAEEIVYQVLYFARLLAKENKKVTNVVVMGMGEPFANYEQVLKALHILNDPQGLNIGARKLSISTVGLKSGIEKFTLEKLQINLAISLHAPNDRLRNQLIPHNKHENIKTLFFSS